MRWILIISCMVLGLDWSSARHVRRNASSTLIFHGKGPGSLSRLLKCQTGEVLCRDGTECIDKEQICNGEMDCSDESDEMDDYHNCQLTQRRRHKRSKSKREEECDSEEWSCDESTCTSSEEICDGVFNCNDQTDEDDCGEDVVCTEDQFECTDKKRCLEPAQVCDYVPHCADDSDELNCPSTPGPDLITAPPCNPETEFRCVDNLKCVSKDDTCNYYKDCHDWSDESTTGSDCSCFSEFLQSWCHDKSMCLLDEYACDGILDCQDGSDEWGCDCEEENELPCKLSSWCYYDWQRCDGNKNCPHGDDEEGCLTDPSRTHRQAPATNTLIWVPHKRPINITAQGLAKQKRLEAVAKHRLQKQSALAKNKAGAHAVLSRDKANGHKESGAKVPPCKNDKSALLGSSEIADKTKNNSAAKRSVSEDGVQRRSVDI